jgi:hypothetical protein
MVQGTGSTDAQISIYIFQRMVVWLSLPRSITSSKLEHKITLGRFLFPYFLFLYTTAITLKLK